MLSLYVFIRVANSHTPLRPSSRLRHPTFNSVIAVAQLVGCPLLLFTAGRQCDGGGDTLIKASRILDVPMLVFMAIPALVLIMDSKTAAAAAGAAKEPSSLDLGEYEILDPE